MFDQQQQLAALQHEVAHLRREVRQQRRHRRPHRGRFFLIGCIALLAALAPLGLLAGSSQPFADVDPNSVHYTNIIAIRQAGITNGCNPAANLYCPNNNVTRQEMASFLARTAGIGGNPPVANALTLSGLPANAFSRTNSNGFGFTNPGQGIALTKSWQTLTSTTLNIPTNGFVFVIGTTHLYWNGTTGSGGANIEVCDPTSGACSWTQFADLGAGSGNVLDASVTGQTSFTVTPGQRTFILRGGLAASAAGPTNAYNATITALFVPFGPGGAIGAGLTNTLVPMDHQPQSPPR
jgi:hypothetical protein